jgi:hypothetical protein
VLDSIIGEGWTYGTFMISSHFFNASADDVVKANTRRDLLKARGAWAKADYRIE